MAKHKRDTASITAADAGRFLRTKWTHIYMRPTRDPKVVRFYGDFRDFRQHGGKRELLVAADGNPTLRTLEEARKRYDERRDYYIALRDAAARGVHHPPTAEPAPFLELGRMLRLFLEHADADANMAPSTARRHATATLALYAHFGDIRADAITAEHLAAYRNARRATPGRNPGTNVSDRTIANELMTLSAAFRLAVSRGQVAKNPVSGFEHGLERRPPEAAALDRQEAARLLQAAATLDGAVRAAREEIARYRAWRKRPAGSHAGVDPSTEPDPCGARPMAPLSRSEFATLLGRASAFDELELLAAALLYTGGRIEEVCALKVEDIDFTSRKVSLPWNKVRRENAQQRVVVGLKQRGTLNRRTVPLWPGFERRVRAYLTRTGVTQGCLFRGAGRNAQIRSAYRTLHRAFVLAGLRTASPAPGATATEVDYRVTAHLCRHTYTSWMLRVVHGVVDGKPATYSTWEVAQLLGHRNAERVQDTYGHAVPENTILAELDFDVLDANQSAA